ncbi:MAG: AAA family ATPase [Synergistaceae bacterium]|nr:AAA family ATPase [Synergistaceae bacterium]
MKITIRDFGPIKNYEVDLNKKFIVNYGLNNIGKSCAMNVIYLLIRNLYRIVSSFPAIIFSVEEFNNHPIFRDMKLNFNATFGRGNLSNKYSGKQLEIVLESESPFFYVVFGEKEGELCLTEVKYDFPPLTPEEQKISTALSLLPKCFGKHLVPHFIPASRLGLYQGFIRALAPTIAEISKIRGVLQNPYIPLPHLTVPVADYIATLLHPNPFAPTELFQQKIMKIAEDIEKELIDGDISFNEQQQSFYYKPHNVAGEIGVEYASSMVGELAPLVHIIRKLFTLPMESLFYEEPEAHLHPEKQAILAEKLVCLSELGISAMISTHSNYMFNKFNNFVLSGRLSCDDYLPILMEPTLEGSVSRVMEMDELGVLDENFISTTEKLYDEREEIIEKLNGGRE